eukprot:Rmarinus@m.16441
MSSDIALEEENLKNREVISKLTEELEECKRTGSDWSEASRLLQSLQNERSTLASRISVLTKEKEQLRLEYMESMELSTKTNDGLKNRLLNLEERLVELRSQRDSLADGEAEAKNELLEIKRAHTAEIKSLTDASQTLRQENERLRRETTESKCLLQSAQAEISRLCSVHESSDSTASSLRAEVSRLEQAIAEKGVLEESVARLELELEKSTRRVRDLESSLRGADDDRVTIRQLREDLDHAKKRASVVTHKAELAETLQEDLENLQSKLQRQEAMLESAAEADARLHTLERNVADWHRVLSPVLSNVSDGDANVGVVAAKTIVELREEVVRITKQLGDKSEEAAKWRTTAMQQQQPQPQPQPNTEDDAAKSGLQNTTKRLERRVQLFERQFECYKNLLESYEEDSSASAIEAGLRQRVQELESVNEGLRQSSKEAEQLLRAAEGKPGAVPLVSLSDSAARVSALESTVQALQKERDDLQAALSKAEQEIVSLEAKVGRGEYNADATKVVHFIENPESLAKKRKLDTGVAADPEETMMLRNKIADLTERLKIAEASLLEKSSTSGEKDELSHYRQVLETTTASRDEYRHLADKLGRENASYKTEAANAAIRLTRMREIVHDKIREFRKACLFLFGFEIDMNATQYKLRSMYEDAEDKYLFFQSTEQGMILKLNSPVLDFLPDDVKAYYQKQKSLPAFLAAYTLDLFHKQTIVR